MTILLEAFILRNLAMNTLVLIMALRWGQVGHFSVPRVLLAAALGAGYACAALLPGLYWLASWPPRLLILALLLRIAHPFGHWLTFIRGFFLALVLTFLTGGVIYALYNALGSLEVTLILGGGAAVLAVAMLLRTRRHIQEAKRIQLRIGIGEDTAQLLGLVDSGNLLLEPLSGLPVIVIPYPALKGMLPPTLDPRQLETLPPGYRLVGIQTPAGRALLMCFKPRWLQLEAFGGYRNIQAMVAISPSVPVEGAMAIVPASLLDPLPAETLERISG